jgi:hypothetical protein
MSCSVVVCHVVFCRAILCYFRLYYVISCYVVLCYGPYAQTFYMCLESLVGSMTTTLVPLHTFRLTERFYDISLSTFGPRVSLKNFDAVRSILKQI